MTEKTATASTFPERVKNTLRNFFPFTMRTGLDDAVDNQEEEEDNGEIDDFESQVSVNSSTYENGPSTNMETGYSDQFSAVRSIKKTNDGKKNSQESS